MPAATLEPTEFQRKHHSELQIEVDRKVRQRVLDGIELLKKEYGEDWVDHIDMERLDLSSGTSCVLGQLYGDWRSGCLSLGITHRDGEFGFSGAGLSTGVLDQEGFYKTLQAAWIQELGFMMGLLGE